MNFRNMILDNLKGEYNNTTIELIDVRIVVI